MSGLAEDTASLARKYNTLRKRCSPVSTTVEMASLALGGAKGEPGKTSSGIRGGEDI
jgi:hypothetical protein